MKMFFKILFVLTVLFMVGIGMNSQAANLTPCDSREAALLGATHVLRINLDDLASSTSTNTALTLTNNIISANEIVECVNMVLDQVFDTGNTNYTGSVAIKVGDSTDDDLFLTNTELASDGSEVFVKGGRADVPTVTVATNFVATVTAGVTGKKTYTAANYIKVTLTPNAEESLSENTKGAISIYFRKLGK